MSVKENGGSLMVVGLGNPGSKYRNTRHNLGFLILEKCVSRLNIEWKSKKECLADMAQGYVGEHLAYFLRPLTYMNLSGQAVKRASDLLGLTKDHLLVVCDDADLSYGTFRLRGSGSSGGQNGLKSIEEMLDTREYSRLRIGIGRPTDDIELDEYVLEEWSTEEEKLLPEVVAKGAEIVFRWIEKGIQEASMLAVSLKAKS